MKRWVRNIAVLLVGVAVLALVPGAASAQDDDVDVQLGDDTQVVLNGRVLVSDTETVDGVVLFNGTASIEGTVEGDVVVFNGDTTITGRVDGNVVVFSGDVEAAAGSTITGDLITATAPRVDPAADVQGETRRFDFEGAWSGVTLVSKLAWWLAASISILLLGLLMLWLIPTALERLPGEFRRGTGGVVAWGAVGFFGLPILAGLAFVTLVGIPFGLGLSLALFGIYAVGYTVATFVIGRMIIKEPRSRFGAFLIGWVIVRLVALVPILAGIAWFVLALLGLGVIAAAARRRERGSRESVTQEISVPPPPPPA